MPRRREKDTRSIRKKIYIFCEGRKTEPNYFKGLRRALHVPESLLCIQIVDTEYTSCVELVAQAEEIKKSKRPEKEDEFWVVVDKDGYTKHPTCFDNARGKSINIAFSCISFEFWILLHFGYITRQFVCADEIIRFLKKKYQFDYAKNDRDIYDKLALREAEAATNAQDVRAHHKECGALQQPYAQDPYTDVDLLIKSIRDSLSRTSKRSST